MKIVRARLTRVRLSLAVPISTSRGPLAVREGAVLALFTESGEVGYGEALPLDGFGAESVTRSCDALGELARQLLGRDTGELDALLDEAESAVPDAPCARAAVDAALFDLAAAEKGVRVAALLAAPHAGRTGVRVSALLRGDEAEVVAGEALEAVQQGFRTVKLKLGVGDLARDERRVAAVREAVGQDLKIRLDANGAWSEAEAAGAISRLARYEIEFLEQPVAPGDISGMARLRRASPFPIAADEALAGGRAAEEILSCGAADILVLKPSTLGGLRATARLAARAREKGVGCVVTSALDSALGLTAALQLAAALPGSLPAAGLATGRALALDLASAPLPSEGEITLPEPSGMGVSPIPSALASCALGEPLEFCA